MTTALERLNREPVDDKALVVVYTILGWAGGAVGLALGKPISFAAVMFFAFVAVLTGWTAGLAVARLRLGPASEHREPRGWGWSRRQSPPVRFLIGLLSVAVVVVLLWAWG